MRRRSADASERVAASTSAPSQERSGEPKELFFGWNYPSATADRNLCKSDFFTRGDISPGDKLFSIFFGASQLHRAW
jgi:hypothetical protein